MKRGEVILDRYAAERHLGQGGMGSVWLARHRTLGNRVAIKLLDAKSAYRAAQRFLLEARAMAAVRSEHVVRVVDYGDHQGTPAIVMEYLEGESLGDRLDRTDVLTWQFAFDLISQIAVGLADIHACGLLHRDIKPGNIMVCRGLPERAKIVDFGIAKELNQQGPKLTRTGIIVGTPAYMAPEQLMNLSLTPATDVYALGIVLWEAIAGDVPFGDDYSAAVARIEKLPPPPLVPAGLPTMSQEAIDVLMNMLEPDPTRRFRDCDALSQALRAAMSGNKKARRAARQRSEAAAPAPDTDGPLLCVARLPIAALGEVAERKWLTALLHPRARSYTLADIWIAMEPPEATEGGAEARERTLNRALSARYGPTVRVRTRIAPSDFKLTPSALAGLGRLPPVLAELLQQV